MTAEAERRFHGEMIAGVDRLKREIGYNATCFAQMLGELKGLETARQLLHGRDASDGFTTLWEKQRLHLSVEAYALLPWYAGLFEEHHLSTARRRLEAYSFDVNSFLDAARRDPPQWSQTALDGLD